MCGRVFACVCAKTVVRFNNLPLSAAFKWGSSLMRPPGALWASLICEHNGGREGEKAGSKICTLSRPWISPALLHKATWKPAHLVFVKERAVKRDFYFFLFSKILSAQVHNSNMHLPADADDTWCFEVQGISRCAPGASLRSLSKDSLMMKDNMLGCLCSVFRSQGKSRQSQNNFSSLISL